MTRRLLALALVAIVTTVTVVTLDPGPEPAGAGVETGANDIDKVLIVTTPGLRWADLVEHDLPAIEGFLAESVVALMSMRTIGARTGLGEGYITMGVGNRASARSSVAGSALEPDERFEAGTAREAYERRTGIVPSGEVLHLGFPSIVQTNNRFLYGAEPGALGRALVDAGATGGVVANGDQGLAVVQVPTPEVPDGDAPLPGDAPGDQGEAEGEETVVETDEPGVVVDADDEEEDVVSFLESDYGRSAALVVVDATGQVPRGQVDDLLMTDPDAPYGVRYDPDRVTAALDEVWADVDVAVVELSDLDRADAYRREAGPEAADELWATALVDSDRLLDRVLAQVDLTSTAVILASPAAPRAAESLGVFGLRLPDGHGGLAQSGTTRRAGYVTLPDVAPTILDLLDIDVPDAMTGTRIASVEDIDVDDDRFELFAAATEQAVFRDQATGPISVVFVILQILAYGLAAVAVARRRRWTGPVSFLALVVLATPSVGFLAGVLEIEDASLFTYGLGIFAAAVVLAAAAEGAAALGGRLWPRARPLLAPLLLVAFVWLLLVVDVTTGGRLQIDTVFGYSPIVAGRFAGFGNLAFALIGVGAAVVACGAWAAWRLARGDADGSARLGDGAAIAVIGFLAVTVVVDGAPAWGSDVGGVLATVPAYAALVLVAMGIRIDWRRGLLIGAATLAVLAVFSALDLARPEEERTHLGRLVARIVGAEGGGGFGEVIQRKLNTNINILTSSIWTLTIPFALGLMVFLARRQSGFLRDLQEEVPGVTAMLTGGLTVAVLGFALNDSGVAVPAMMFAVLLPYLTYVLLRWKPSES